MPTKTIHDTYKALCKQVTELEARMILKERAGVDWAEIIATPSKEIDVSTIESDLQERLSGKPLSRIYGYREFWSMRFDINQHTLDPRPDSETVIEVALKRFKDRGEEPKTILDLGTGSGCLLLSLLSEFKNARGIGLDISYDAARMARKNAKTLKLLDRAAFLNGNWAESIDQKFDLIIANPPYIASKTIQTLEQEVRNHDPMRALDGGEDGLQDYNAIFSSLFSLLKTDGLALFEIGFDQGEDIQRLIEKHGLNCGGVHLDLAGNPRVVEIFL